MTGLISSESVIACTITCLTHGINRVRRALQNGSRKYPAGARDWPLVLWEDEKVDTENLSIGFLRNRRLLMVRSLAHADI